MQSNKKNSRLPNFLPILSYSMSNLFIHEWILFRTFANEILTDNLQMEINNQQTGYPQKVFGQQVKRFCQTMDLKDDPTLIARYVEAHSRLKSWPEIREGIRAVGILEMEIYILGNRLFMIVETPLDFEWSTAMKKLATLPRQAEWEDYVAMFQACEKGSTSDQKWQLMDRMFYLYE